jgi:hypothetical protein
VSRGCALFGNRGAALAGMTCLRPRFNLGASSVTAVDRRIGERSARGGIACSPGRWDKPLRCHASTGHRRRPQGADPDDLYRPSPLRHQILENQRAQAGDRGRRNGGAPDHRGSRVRGRPSTTQVPQPGADCAAHRQRADTAHRHLLPRGLPDGDDATHRQERAVPLLHLLNQGAPGGDRLQGPYRPHGKARHAGCRSH